MAKRRHEPREIAYANQCPHCDLIAETPFLMKVRGVYRRMYKCKSCKTRWYHIDKDQS